MRILQNLGVKDKYKGNYMIQPIIHKESILTIDNRTFIVKNIWYLGNTKTRYELQEIHNGRNIGDIIKKECKIIDGLVKIGKIKIT